jgi:hypothetical protein
MRSLLLFLFLCATSRTTAQVAVTGRVVDERTQEPLAFVPVNIAGTNKGTVSDIDGRFRLDVPQLPVRIRLSYVGYTSREMSVETAGPVIIPLTQSDLELKPVVVSGADNPAHRIIRRTYAGRKENDAMRNRSYRYTSYSKTTFDAALDSVVANDPARMAKLDTSTLKAKEYFDKQHLFLIESATRKSFIPPARAHEEVLAMRVSGLKDPSLLALAAQTETFSIYEPQIAIDKKLYLSPLAPSSTAKYRFNLEDTLYQGSDSVFVISYRPRKGTKFDALKGVLYINTAGYAVQNVIAEPAERQGVSIKFQQLHERVPSADGSAALRWFPMQLNAFIYLDQASINGMGIYGESRTYLKEVEVDADVERREVRGPELVADRMEIRRDDAYWKALRTDTLDAKDLKTYAVIDSIGDSLNLDAKLKWVSALASGKLAMGPVDLLLARIIDYNGYEGLRLGAGLATNDKVSRYGTIGGYVGYGFRDEKVKYGGDLTILPLYGRDLHVKFSYANDVDETGGVAFLGQRRGLFTQDNVRRFYVDRMDRLERMAAEVKVRLGGSVKMWVGTERSQRINDIGYRFARSASDGVTLLQNSFLTGMFTMDLRWAFREKLARLPGREVSLGTKYPVVNISAMRAFKGLWEGELDTWRVNAMVEKTFRIRLVGDLSLRVLAGKADPNAPMPFLYNLRGTNARQGLLIAADNTFETMRPNEFLADEYITVHLKHSFGTLLVKGKHFHPKPALVSSAAFGRLSRPEAHRGLFFSPMSEGFFESGLRVDDIFANLGLGVFYRYGPLAFPEWKDNVALKLSTSLNF